MCFDIDRFVDQEIANDLKCSICQNVLCCPQINFTEPKSKQEQIKDNSGGHKFCEKCIIDWLQVNNSCPDCREHLSIDDLHGLDRFASNSLKRLQVRCIYHKIGCKYVDKLELIQNHEFNSCPFGTKECSNCGSITQNSIVHTEIDCINKLIEAMKTKDSHIEHLTNNIKHLSYKLEIKSREINKLSHQNNELKAKLEACEFNEKILKHQIINQKLNLERNKIRYDEDLHTNLGAQMVHRIDVPELLKLCDSVENNYHRVKHLIEEKNARIDYKDKDGFTPLMKASEKGHLSIVKLLIQYGANVNDKSTGILCNGYTPLLFASEEGHYDIAKLLIQNGANINEKTGYNSTALIRASCRGHANLVKLLIDNGANVNERNDNGETALAYGYNHFEVAKILIDSGADINCRTNSGDTVIMEASRWGKLNTVKLLIDKGANINDRNNNGESVLIKATHGKNNMNVIKLLVECGANVCEKDKDGKTVLILASTWGTIDLIRILIRKGAIVNEKDNDGRTALIFASEYGRLDIVKTLIHNGAVVNEKDNFGCTALFAASDNGRRNVVEYLKDINAV